ncbi:MAG: XdhC family protein [Saprospiraceae bacterium]|jgi:xanthine dehydrogenase accessory factor|nr:XdhC family protein [Saprospiraceae bacterium]
MFNEFLQKTQILYRDNEPFAIASVINRQLPSSGKPGDKAVIDKEGRITGWVGGGCTRGIILKEAGNALKDGQPRIVRISPDQDSSPKPGVIDYKMTCYSGGSVEVFIEPVLPRPQLVVMGKSHVAKALCRLAKAMDYSIFVVAANAEDTAFPDADKISPQLDPSQRIPENAFVVVCTQGENDEAHLAQALHTRASYIGFVSSRKKANAVFQTLRQEGFAFDQLKRIKTPAGLDIQAKLAEEIAISILAEIITLLRNGSTSSQETTTRPDTPEYSAESPIFINPVCQVPVEKSTAKHVVEHEGLKYYFCCDGCKVTFEKTPEKYALQAST